MRDGTLFEMLYDFLFEMSDSDLNRFEIIYVLSFRNDAQKFSYAKLFSSGDDSHILVTKMTSKSAFSYTDFFAAVASTLR